MADPTEQARERWNENAPRYDREMRFFEKVLFGGARTWACSRARSDVLEIAVGTGRNFAFYPPDVRLTGIELSPKMLELALMRAKDSVPNADLRLGDAQRLEFADASFDTVVCTLSLCSIPDPRAAVAEFARVLKPGGRLVLVEHVRSSNAIVRTGQRMLEGFANKQGDWLLREPLDHVRALGLEVEVLERAKWGIVERVVARKPPVQGI